MIPPRKRISCPDCRGTGRTPGLAADLARATPLRSVTLSDREPAYFQDGGRAFWYWEPGYAYPGPHQLPFEVTELFDHKADFIGGLMVYTFLTPDRARAALSRAAVALARRRANIVLQES